MKFGIVKQYYWKKFDTNIILLKNFKQVATLYIFSFKSANYYHKQTTKHITPIGSALHIIMAVCCKRDVTQFRCNQRI